MGKGSIHNIGDVFHTIYESVKNVVHDAYETTKYVGRGVGAVLTGHGGRAKEDFRHGINSAAKSLFRDPNRVATELIEWVRHNPQAHADAALEAEDRRLRTNKMKQALQDKSKANKASNRYDANYLTSLQQSLIQGGISGSSTQLLPTLGSNPNLGAK